MAFCDAPLWREAINSELDSIMSNHVLKLIDLPRGTKPTGCKWIFKRKLKDDGSIGKYKTKSVAKGFPQKKNIDYFDTYAPVIWITSIRVLTAITTVHNLHVHQMNIKMEI